MQNGQTPFDDLPQFKDSDFSPPDWAKNFTTNWDKPGESSKSAFQKEPSMSNREDGASAEHTKHDADLSDDEEVWEDALEGPTLLNDQSHPLTLAELQVALDKASALKDRGNKLFTSKPPSLDDAAALYAEAISLLPELPPPPQKPKPRIIASSGIQEITDEEADEIEAEETNGADEEEDARRRLEEDIRECTKACWGNLGACHLALLDDKEAVKACTKALELDPNYLKALQRRATANERIGSWTSLTAAQTDCELMMTLLPAHSPLCPSTKAKLSTLSARIKIQQEQEKDEMMSKLKDLGNSLLGNFGLSTDNFKFDPQPGGGYSMRFER